MLPVDWSHEVSLVCQPENGDLCWLAAAAMAQSWLAQRSVSLSEAARCLGQDYESLFAAEEGLNTQRYPGIDTMSSTSADEFLREASRFSAFQAQGRLRQLRVPVPEVGESRAGQLPYVSA